jgi:hypothetical protein
LSGLSFSFEKSIKTVLKVRNQFYLIVFLKLIFNAQYNNCEKEGQRDAFSEAAYLVVHTSHQTCHCNHFATYKAVSALL